MISTIAFENIHKAHIQRRWALQFLLQVRNHLDQPLLEQIADLRALQDPVLGHDLRSKALGAALEILIADRDKPIPHVTACLFATWSLSHEFELVGPRFKEILARDPIGYCMGLEAFGKSKAVT